ncbi:MAG TPA: YihY family inner membrane protein [Burkholderiaceae bacterium]|nr:YihY family inner membrane protein [Burkholderiaceae bacterium]
MRLNLAPWLDRYPWLKRARDVAIFAQRRATDVKMAQVAGSLTFTTTLTIVPLFAVALALFTAFPLFVEFRGGVENAVLKALPGQISDTVLRYINEFALKATRLTAVGLIFLAVTAIAMMVTFDRVMNDIWRVKNRRPLTQRVLIYWAILTLGPLLVGASLAASSYVWAQSSGTVSDLPRWIRGSIDYVPAILSGFAYAALFVYVPNRRVAWRDALIGGFIAAILAEMFKHAFGEFVSRGTTGSIYGAFAVLPLFLIWIYMSWYAVLFGAAITATLPRLRATRFSDEMLAGNQFVTSVALLKALLQAKQSKSPAMSPAELARQIRMSVDETDALLEALEKMGYVRRLAVTRTGRRSDHDWMLTCDENSTTLKPLFEHFAVDPANSLLNTDALGLRPMRARWFQSDWLKASLADELADQKH